MGTHPPVQGVILSSHPCVLELRSHTKFQEIYNNVEDKTENIRKLISSILGLTMREHLADIKNGIDQ
ncbi:MAG: hypothetical protein Q8842_03035, partial [Candidatus Phytoplasma australasiaticum]|nr:hypothetical protein [Candidatus Phytoplasma australasiaticum]